MKEECLRAMAQVSNHVATLFTSIAETMFSLQPCCLGSPGDETQSAYYPGPLRVGSDEIAKVSQVMEDNGVLPEITRVRKIMEGENIVYEVLQASVETDCGNQILNLPQLGFVE